LSITSTSSKTKLNFADEKEYNEAIEDVIYKRKQGTKMCKDVLEKKLAIEKKAAVCLI
jgi:hypothetical protein